MLKDEIKDLFPCGFRLLEMFPEGFEVLEVKLPLEPVACPRPRVTGKRTYYPKKYTTFQKQVPSLLGTRSEPLVTEDNFLFAYYLFVVKRPKYMKASKYSKNQIEHRKRPDKDNYEKAINDSLQRCNIISDDSILSFTASKKVYAAEGENAHIQIQLYYKEEAPTCRSGGLESKLTKL